MDQAGGTCDRCGGAQGRDPFLLRLDLVNWQRFTFCPKCAGLVRRDLIRYLKVMKRNMQPGLF